MELERNELIRTLLPAPCRCLRLVAQGYTCWYLHNTPESLLSGIVGNVCTRF